MLIAALALGCTGYLRGEGGESGPPGPLSSGAPLGSGSGNGSGSMTTAECSGAATNVAEIGLRRLNRAQYDATLRELGLLGPGESVAKGFTGDSTVGGRKHGFTSGGAVDPVLSRDLLDAAISVAGSPAATKLAGCQPQSATEQDSCARDVIGSFGRRAFRRSLTPAERDELFQVFDAVRQQSDFQGGMQAMLAAILSAPEFLYLVEAEQGAAGSVVALDGPALASRLSYFLWDSAPDEALLTAAEAGQLSTVDGMRSAAARLFDDPRARPSVERFLREWTGIDRLAEAQKVGADGWYTPELVSDLQASLLGSLEGAFFGAEPTLRELMASKTLLVNDRIATAYGLSGSGASLSPVTAPAERLGFLTHPAFMALQAKPTRSDPIHRGLFVREQLLCDELPDPPVTDENGNPIVFNVGDTGPGVTNRQRFKEHTAAALCAGCHTLIDPLGFGFENYDQVGRFRTSDENGNAIDASGDVQGDNDATGSFNGASELVARLAQSKTVARCLTVQWFRYGLGRDEADADSCALSAVQARFDQSDGNLKEMLLSLASSDSFRYRKVGAR